MVVYNLITPVYNWNDGHYSVGIFTNIHAAIKSASKHSNASTIYLKYFDDVLCLSIDSDEYDDHECADYKIIKSKLVEV